MGNPSIWYYVWIDLLDHSWSQGFHLGFDKTLPLYFSFGGAISTLARQGGGYIMDLHWSFFCLARCA
jgi:hypothetical protein